MLDRLIEIFGSRTKALEILYLVHDLKPVVRQGFYDSQISTVIEFCNKNNLYAEISPYKILLQDRSFYSNKGKKIPRDDPRKGMYFVYISKNENKSVSAEAFEMSNDHRSLGLILGYPKCCINFYMEYLNTVTDKDFLRATVKESKSYRYPFYTNIARRGSDLTLLNHFPCSFDCQKSIDIGKANYKFIKQHLPKTAELLLKSLKGRILIYDRFFEFY